MEIICLNPGSKNGSACVATIGMFDGVHLGHRYVINRVVEQAREAGLTSTVITFNRPPRQVLDPTYCAQLLTTLPEKEAAIRELGVDTLVVLPFTREMAGLSAREFMETVLCRQLQVQILVTGYDNRFGRDRTEGFDDYVRYGRELGIQVVRGDAELMADGRCPVSSSVIRQLLAEDGHVDLMPHYLTHFYRLRGVVAAGEHVGHLLGYPTANLVPDDSCKLIPAGGVYAVWVSIEGTPHPMAAMMNIGNRPTFHGNRQTLEVNIFDFDGDLYGQALTVSFVRRLRTEQCFESPEALTAQLEKDKQQVIDILR